MEQETMGTVAAVTRQWWMKVNTKAVRLMGSDGAVYPHVVRVTYQVGGRTYTKRKWFGAGAPVPSVGSAVKVVYDTSQPARARITGC